MSSKNSFSRMDKICEAIHRELAKVISMEVKDPRLGFVTISGVEVTKDLSLAKVMVTVLNEEKSDESIKVLNGAAGFLRSRLAENTTMRKVPSLRFVFDKTSMQGHKIDAILDSLDKNKKD